MIVKHCKDGLSRYVCTFAIEYDKVLDTLFVAWSKCNLSHQDKFTKKTGYAIATSRLFKLFKVRNGIKTKTKEIDVLPRQVLTAYDYLLPRIKKYFKNFNDNSEVLFYGKKSEISSSVNDNLYVGLYTAENGLDV